MCKGTMLKVGDIMMEILALTELHNPTKIKQKQIITNCDRYHKRKG